jgi:adenylate kinase family enzyme
MDMTAIILIGHSNAGKSPLGSLLETDASSPGRRLLHFDFGAHLRAVAARQISLGLSDDQVAFIESILDGRLLDADHFHLALRLVDWFVNTCNFNASRDLLILNGLPRSIAQADALAHYGVRAKLVTFLDCTPQNALRRKQMAEGGRGHEDRSDRNDAAVAIFERKIRSFEMETRPLLDWYVNAGADVVRIEVLPSTTPRQMHQAILPKLLRL